MAQSQGDGGGRGCWSQACFMALPRLLMASVTLLLQHQTQSGHPSGGASLTAPPTSSHSSALRGNDARRLAILLPGA